MGSPKYAELHCYSPFSFHRGASSVAQLYDRASELGLTALAITDRDGLYAAVRQWKHRISDVPPLARPIYGAELCLADSSRLVALVRDGRGWRNLCSLISKGRGGCEKGMSLLTIQQLAECREGLTFLSGGRSGPIDRILLGLDSSLHMASWRPRGPWGRDLGRRDASVTESAAEDAHVSLVKACDEARLSALLRSRRDEGLKARCQRALCQAGELREALGDRFFIEVQDHCLPEDQWLRERHADISRQLDVPRVATNMVHYARLEDRCLQDVLTCIRTGRTLRDAGTGLLPNGHFCLKSAAQMALRFADDPAALSLSVELAAECGFDLADLPYSFPDYPVPDGHSLQSYLEEVSYQGAADRYGRRLEQDSRIRGQLRHELAVIRRMGLAGYFLVVWDLVQECRRRSILCQGRGSAANSCVCYCLGITAVDPIHLDLLFERFLSESRGGFPDIDVDISNSRREEILQFVYDRYGRDHAAMVSNVVTYQPRSALRDVGKVFGLGAEQLTSMAGELHHHDDSSELRETYRSLCELGGDSGPVTMAQVLEYSDKLCGLPRHMGIHSGGFVVSGLPLLEVCPIENAAMVDRTVLQWDKDDVAHAGLVKIDLLGLGMLSAIEEASTLLAGRGIEFDMAKLSYDDARVYDLICAADTVGLFQIESRAQMNTLPRLRPRCFHDLVVEVALIRPGPIQGGMVHPYLRRRQGREPVSYDHPSLEPILSRTLGIPLFQEQAMKMAVATAGFSPAQADRLRKVMGFKRESEELQRLFEEMKGGMRRKGIGADVASKICELLRGFADYGFPESHAASFALLVYASAWLKCYQAPAFFAALLNCQPMGFYSPATLVADARRHGVEIRPVSIAHSGWRWRLEGALGIRAGFLQLRGFSEKAAESIVAERDRAEFGSVGEFCDRVQLHRDKLELLADSGAFDELSCDRRQALWQVAAWRRRRPLEGPVRQEALPGFMPLTPMQQNLLDHQKTGFSARQHPLSLLRQKLRDLGVSDSGKLRKLEDEDEVFAAGLVIARQRPSTARGTFFVTLEDELGFINVVVPARLFDDHQRLLRQVLFLGCRGRVQRRDGVCNVLAVEFEDLDKRALLSELWGGMEGQRVSLSCRDFR
ncbi:MAG: error-prone DNA polymerase [Rickettsiales bacterium]|nr:error-prone DNA polymerase [Rickettsiales bacterium]